MKYHYRITWIDGKAFVQRCPVTVHVEVPMYPQTDRTTRPGNYATDGEIVRPATDEDRKAMYDGRLDHDSETEPGRLAWAEHVARGGD
jgi:hypothetical protein